MTAARVLFALALVAVVFSFLLDAVFGVGVTGGLSLGILLGYALADAEQDAPPEASAADVVAWLDAQPQTGYIGANFKQVIARNVAEEFGVEPPRDYIQWYDDDGFGRRLFT